MKTAAQYIAECKAALGDATMSDRELGERLGGYSQPEIARAKGGYMTDKIAIALATAIGLHSGELLFVARATREKNSDVRRFLMEATEAALQGIPLPRVTPGVVIRGGRKVVPLGQEWRKR